MNLKTYIQYAIVAPLLFLLFGCQTSGHNLPVKVVMTTDMGEVQIELYQHQAPVTVSNFLKYVDEGVYDDGSFYRVVRADNDNGNPQITVIQGDVKDGRKQWPAIELESTDKTGIRHLDGTLSMARLGPNTATSTFFICIDRQAGLDFGGKRAADGQGFAAFGKVIKGMEVVRAINNIRHAKTTNNAYMKGQMLTRPVVIKSITRL